MALYFGVVVDKGDSNLFRLDGSARSDICVAGLVVGIVQREVGQSVEVVLQVRISVFGQRCAVLRVGRIQSHRHLVGIGHTIGISVNSIFLSFAQSQRGVTTIGVARSRSDGIGASLESDVCGRVDDARSARSIGGSATTERGHAITSATRLIHQTLVLLVIAGQVGTGTSRHVGHFLIGLFGGHRFVARQGIGYLVENVIPVVDRHVQGRGRSAESCQVVVVDGGETGIAPVAARWSVVAGEFELVARQIPFAHLAGIVARRVEEMAVAAAVHFGGWTRAEIVVPHIDAVVGMQVLGRVGKERGIELSAVVTQVSAAPVVEHVVGKVAVNVAVVGILLALLAWQPSICLAYAIESGRTTIAVGNQDVVHVRVVAAPLHGKGTTRVVTRGLDIVTMIESFAHDTILNGRGVVVEHGETLLHAPRHGAMVQQDVGGILDVQSRITLVAASLLGGDVASAETHITDNVVAAVDDYRIARHADATARSTLSQDGYVRVVSLEFAVQVDRTIHGKEDGAR